MPKQRVLNLIDYLAFMLNKNADIYGYVVDYDATWSTQKEYIKDIFALETCTDLDYVTKPELKTMFLEWLSDMDCLVNVVENLDYSDNYKLNFFLPNYMHNKGEQAKLDYINNQIFKLIFA